MQNKTIVNEIMELLAKYDLTFEEANNILMATISKIKQNKIKF